MLVMHKNLAKTMLVFGMVTAAGCSWPSVKLGGDEYLLSPTPSKEIKNDPTTSGTASQMK